MLRLAETLVEAASAEPFAHVLDLGTGTGCILLSLLQERPKAIGVGTDLSDAALTVARQNAIRHDLTDRAGFLLSDWLANVEGTFDLIVSNPPYIAEAEMAGLDPEVRDHDPRMALTPGGDGLDAYRAIAAGATAHLVPGGRILAMKGIHPREELQAVPAGYAVEVHALTVPGLSAERHVAILRAPSSQD